MTEYWTRGKGSAHAGTREARNRRSGAGEPDGEGGTGGRQGETKETKETKETREKRKHGRSTLAAFRIKITLPMEGHYIRNREQIKGGA